MEILNVEATQNIDTFGDYNYYNLHIKKKKNCYSIHFRLLNTVLSASEPIIDNSFIAILELVDACVRWIFFVGEEVDVVVGLILM